jgi:hypothetical protein
LTHLFHGLYQNNVPTMILVVFLPQNILEFMTS